MSMSSECDYKTKHIGHFKQHAKSIHELVLYSCDQCDYKGIKEHPSHISQVI